MRPRLAVLVPAAVALVLVASASGQRASTASTPLDGVSGEIVGQQDPSTTYSAACGFDGYIVGGAHVGARSLPSGWSFSDQGWWAAGKSMVFVGFKNGATSDIGFQFFASGPDGKNDKVSASAILERCAVVTSPTVGTWTASPATSGGSGFHGCVAISWRTSGSQATIDFSFGAACPGAAPPSAPARKPAPSKPAAVQHRGPYLSARASLLWCTDLALGFCATDAGSLPATSDVTMVCWQDDASFTGAYKSRRWFYVRAGGQEGFVHSSWVQKQAIVPNCSRLPWLAATEWALRQLGKSIDKDKCLGFVAQAYRVAHAPIPGPYGNDVSAASWWAAQPGSSRTTGAAIPPRGALVFWGARPRYPDGHAALSLGNGWVISTAERRTSVIHAFRISARDPVAYRYLGFVARG